MTEAEWDDTMTTMHSLFPRAKDHLNGETIGLYRSLFRRLNAEQARMCLRHYRSKHGRTFPDLPDLEAWIRQWRRADQPKGDRRERPADWWSTHRREWRRPELTDADVERLYADQLVERLEAKPGTDDYHYIGRVVFETSARERIIRESVGCSPEIVATNLNEWRQRWGIAWSNEQVADMLRRTPGSETYKLPAGKAMVKLERGGDAKTIGDAVKTVFVETREGEANDATD